MQDWKKKHKQVIEDFLKYLNSRTDDYVLKGGTSLMMCYGLDRFSEDVDLDSTNKHAIKNIIDAFCKEHKYTYRIAKDTDTVKRYMISYDKNTENPKPLKIEVSYRKRQIDRGDTVRINNIRVYNINNIALMKANAYSNRDKIRDLYDVSFICNNYFEELEKTTKKVLSGALEYKGIEQYDVITRTQVDELIDPDDLAEKFLLAWDKLELAESPDNSPSLAKNRASHDKEMKTAPEYMPGM